MLDLGRLRRHPDIEASNLAAYDATDRYLIDTAVEQERMHGAVAVIGDRHGALTLGALSAGADHVRVHQDSLVSERALRTNAAALGFEAGRFEQLPLGPDVVHGADTVLMQLPRGLDALDELAVSIAMGSNPDTVLLAGGRVKHMTRAMNDVLLRYFGTVEAQYARQKSRLLVVTDPRSDVENAWPRHEYHERFKLTLVAYGAVFGGTALDPGATALLEHLPEMRDAETAIDLGCGNGALAVVLAKHRPGMHIVASDVSSAAVASARLTATENGVEEQIEVRRADGLEGAQESSVPLILLNPPFHLGATVHTGMAERLISQAGRVLAPGGELWCVWNSHLRYRPLLERIGPTRQASRNAAFTVTVTRK